MQLVKTPHTTFTFSVTVGGESFQPCILLSTLWAVRKEQVEIWHMSQKKINALNRVGALHDTIQKQIAKAGPKIDDYIDDLKTMIQNDPDLNRLWDERYAEFSQ